MPHSIAQTLVDRYGQTFAQSAGITLRDKPSPLWRLLVLSLLLSARIDSAIAVRSAGELSRAGWRTPESMGRSTWQQRVDALGRGGYRRYDERTSTQLGEAADLVHDRWRGDLRRLHDDSGDDADAIAEQIQQVKGIGPAGASIFVREVQAAWTGLMPYVDGIVVNGTDALGLPTDAAELARLVPSTQFPGLVAGCVRAALDSSVADDVRRRALS